MKENSHLIRSIVTNIPCMARRLIKAARKLNSIYNKYSKISSYYYTWEFIRFHHWYTRIWKWCFVSYRKRTVKNLLHYVLIFKKYWPSMASMESMQEYFEWVYCRTCSTISSASLYNARSLSSLSSSVFHIPLPFASRSRRITFLNASGLDFWSFLATSSSSA